MTVGQRQRVAGGTLQHDCHQEQDRDAGQEDDPAFEIVQESFGMFDAETVDQNADHADAEGIHQHRDRGGRQQQQRLVPERPPVEDRHQVGKGQDREEVAQARAGLGHLELVDAQIDDVAVEKDRDAGKLHEPDADL